MTAARTAPAWCGDIPLTDQAASLAATDTRGAATAALAALSATTVTRGSATPPLEIEEFVDSLAGVLPFRLTVHQRETLGESLFRAVDALVAQRSR